MADKNTKKLEEEEVLKKAEEDRLAAEKEFMEKHERDRRLSSHSQRRMSVGTGGTTSANSSQAESGAESELEKKKRSRTSPDEKTRRKSRKTEESDSEDEAVEGGRSSGDSASALMGILNKMKDWWKQPQIVKLVTNPQTAKFARYMNMFQEEIMRIRVRDRLRAEIVAEERAAFLKVVKEEISMKKSVAEEPRKEETSFASVVSRGKAVVPKVTGVKGPVLPAPKVVLVRHQTKESEEVKNTLKNLVKPSEIGLKVRRLINIRNGVMVEAENEEGVESLMKQQALKDAGLKVEKPSRKRPVIMVYDVNASLKDEDVSEEVFQRNMSGSEINKDEFKQEFEVKHRYKDVKSVGRKVHIVAECSVRVRNWLRRKEKIFVEWQCCRVKDYADVARCYKCQRFGHVAKHCTAVKPCCSYCAGEHVYKDCENKKKKGAACCANCKRESRSDTKHEAGSRNCPVYEKAVKRQNEKIDYGL